MSDWRLTESLRVAGLFLIVLSILRRRCVTSNPALLKVFMVLYVTDLVLRLLQSLHLRSVDHHAETFPLVLFKVLLVKSLAVEHALLLETQILWSVGHNGEGGFGVMHTAVRFLLKAFVGRHAQGHLADLAAETTFVPILIKAINFFCWVNWFIASSTGRIHDGAGILNTKKQTKILIEKVSNKISVQK